jgi:hypothetical protein
MENKRLSIFLLGNDKNEEKIKELSYHLMFSLNADGVRWIQRYSESSPLLDWVCGKINRRDQFAEFLSHIAILRRFISECRSDFLLFLRDDLTNLKLDEIQLSENVDFLFDASVYSYENGLIMNLSTVKGYLMSYRYALRCLNLFDSCSLPEKSSRELFSYGLGKKISISDDILYEIDSKRNTNKQYYEGVYTIPREISPDIISWLCYDSHYENCTQMTSDLGRFLCHLSAIKQASRDCSDSAVFHEEKWQLCDDFDDKLGDIIDLLPNETEVLLLTHTIDNWISVKPFELDDADAADDIICIYPIENESKYCAYWMTRGWIEKIINRFDKPLRFVSEMPTIKDILPNDENGFLTVYKPLIYRKDLQEYADYFNAYY